ncbi:MAG: SET domain-containing protein, partial [Colwellia sp.]|nr:SET domain-containing protein [Colwellia sp.]
RFANHSCNPNCVTMEWNIDERHVIGFFAQSDIRQGEELTIDYRFNRVNKETVKKCLCQSANCRGTW